MVTHFALTMLVALLSSLSASAYNFDVDGIYYYKLADGESVEVTNRGCSGSYSGDIVIPSTVTDNETTYSVTSIGDEAFYWCKSLTSVVIPNSVTSIGSSAFYGCSSLTSVTIPNSVTSIGSSAFSYCSNLTSVVIGNSVTEIGSSAFSCCSNLTSVTIPNSVTSIGSSAFSYCSNLTSVVIGNSVTEIGSAAFESCKNLTSVEIPNSVTEIGSSAFSHCSKLTSVEIPNSVTSIGSSAFSACSNLTSVKIPNSVTEIGSSAFYYCKSLTSVVIPNSVTAIGDGAFDNCSSLTSVEIPNSVTTIGYATFYECSSLTSVEIPNSVTSIGNQAFCNCSSLTSVEIPNSVTSIGNQAFYNCSSLTSVVIGNSVTSIGSHAFYECSSLTSVEIPNSVTSIEMYAFCNCSSLTSVEIPNSVTSIGGSAFRYCSSLTSVEIPNSVTSIENNAFTECTALKTIYLGEKLQSIGYYAFRNCTEVTSITSTNLVPPTCGSDAFYGIDNLSCEVNVRPEALEAYKSAPVWSQFQILQAYEPTYTTNIYNGTSGSTPQALTVAQIQALETGNNSLVFVNANLATEFDANIVKKNGSGNWVASEIKLVDAQPFYCPSDVTAGEISYTRTFTTDCWQPLYLPFEVRNDAAVQAIGKVAYINNVHQYDTALDGSGETIIEYLSVPDGATLLANRMYVIKPNAEVLGKEVAFTAEDETLKATTSANIACSSTTHRYTFTGIYQPKTDMASTGAYALTAEGFNRAANDAQTLSPFRFFLTVTNIDNAYGNAAPAAAPSRIRIMVDGVIDGEAMGIDAAHTETIRRESGSYNLAGQKVGEGYRGIVIKNGKKIRL